MPWEVPGLIFIKLLIHPLIVFGLMLLLGPFPPVWAATAVLLASLPPALNVFVIARQYDSWIEPASVAVLLGDLRVGAVPFFREAKTGQIAFP